MFRSSLGALRGRAVRHASRRFYATVTDLKQYPKPGEEVSGFTLRRSKHFPELELSALELQHKKTGAQYLHVARDDSNNVFSIGFKTNPPDATGVPHILEHTTLCGSEKYPVRDPFFKMLPRSLSNFMNAFTSADHTTYPFATTNPQDFKNLMSVYLDATLHPLLNANDFNQEGWRIGPENPTDGQHDNLVFKGVVYNEMKGQMSDASYLYYIRFHEHLYPSLNNSGGDPQKITDLTHKQLTDFHHHHYHPSNAKIFTYGDMPLADHLAELDSRLKTFQSIPVDSDIKLPITLNGPQNITIKGPLDPLVPPDSQFKTSTSWLLADGGDVLERFSLSLLSALLLDGYGSPFYRGLVEAGLGSDFTPNTGFDPSTRIPVFSVGLTGVKEENVSRIKEAVAAIFQEARDKGFDKIKVDGLLHQLELGLKHKTAHFGMGIMQRVKPDWFNGLDPFNSLAWQDTVSAFKTKYAKGGFLESLIDKYFMNDNTLTFTMEPAEAYAQDLATEEANRLSAKIEEVTKKLPNEEEAHKYLAERELDLLKEQEAAANQDLSCLPTLNVKDIPRQKETKELRHSSVNNVSVQWREAPTNGLTYFRAIRSLKKIPNELREVIPLFSESIMRLGTRDKTMEQLEELIRLRTGGVSVGYHLATSPHNLGEHEEGFILSGHAFDNNIPAMYELLQTLIMETNFDGPEAEAKLRELLQMSANGALDAIASRGHTYARKYAEASLTPTALLREQTSGLTQVKLTAALASRPASESLQDVVAKLKAIQALVIGDRQNLRVALNCGTESISSNEKALDRFLTRLPSSTAEGAFGQGSSPPITGSKTFFNLPYQVYYAGLALPTVPYAHPSGAHLQILSQLLTHKHLHREIREKGGAYGGGAHAQGLGGVFSYYSYRDPNPQNTISVMQQAGEWARDRKWTEEEMGEAKLSVFQSVDAPESVSAEGMTKFLYGVDDAMAQKRREQLLDVTAEDVSKVAQEYLVDGASKASLAVLGAQKDWVKGSDGWDVKDLGMAQRQQGEDAEGSGLLQQATA
ncbi:hypothetical protein NA57DRAFT_47202 [Rhizodiscina lignyota]|uniref:Presequence protease, mitochondrial n=1 Tax=Rhizodiscina lignyota TaxID=1504668 RepID=A0A9P4I6W4_9PEZI|nr:hypothetical protein NA57DRAFT_47202 [Rhizodiscina lignyota]